MAKTKSNPATGKAIATFPALTVAERTAILSFAERHGSLWKDRLSDHWAKSTAEPTLCRLRKTHGPHWLHQVDLDSVATKAVTSGQEALSDDLGKAVADAIAAEVRTLRMAGYSKAYICERSEEIKDRVRIRLARDQAEASAGKNTTEG